MQFHIWQDIHRQWNISKYKNVHSNNKHCIPVSLLVDLSHIKWLWLWCSQLVHHYRAKPNGVFHIGRWTLIGLHTRMAVYTLLINVSRKYGFIKRSFPWLFICVCHRCVPDVVTELSCLLLEQPLPAPTMRPHGDGWAAHRGASAGGAGGFRGPLQPHDVFAAPRGRVATDVRGPLAIPEPRCVQQCPAARELLHPSRLFPGLLLLLRSHACL